MENNNSSKKLVIIIAIILIGIIGFFTYKYFDKTVGTIHITYKRNGASSIGKISDRLIDTNEVELPSIQRTGGYIVGWSTKKNNKKAEYKAGERIKVKKDTTLYAITYKVNSLTINANDIDFVSNKNVTCKAYNEDSTCRVHVPVFNKIGYENRGYSIYPGGVTGTIYPNSYYDLKNNVTIYPVFNMNTRGKAIQVKDTINKYNINIDIEYGCSETVINKYLGYIDNIYKYSNYILIGSKISFLAETSFNNLWGAQYLGMNYGPSSLRMFDIKCTESTRSDLYLTMVHELAHTWDFYYSNFFNNPISDEADVMNLFTKYSNYTNKPFRTYSYSNNREFFADMMRYYYFKYLDKKSDFVNLNYPEDIKVVMEKYICIASNNYDKTKCN